jgi:unsaturated chondroitin disaccharide hydrolase
VPVRLVLPFLLLCLAAAAPAGASAAVRLPSAPVTSAWLRATGPGAQVVAAGRRVALARGGRVRVEAVRSGTRVTVALGARRWTGPARGGLRVSGPVRVSSALGTPRTTAALIAHRLLALEGKLHGGWAPDGSAPNGRVRRTRDWKRGFYAGALWRAIEAAPEARRALQPLAWRATRALWGGEGEDTHDVGFVFGEADGGALRVACAMIRTPDCTRAARSLRRAAATLHRLAAATPAGVIPVQARAGCRICTPDERKVFIDSAMNLAPLLDGTGADRALAAHHLDFLARELVRGDGSTIQQLLLSASSGAVTRKLGHDPLGPGSTWARGQAWAVHGFAEAAQALGGPWVALAERTADWTAARSASPGWDWSRPAGRRNPLDTSAAAIAAAGLDRLIALRCAPAASAGHCAAWAAASERLVRRASAHVSARPGQLGRFAGQRYLWDPSRKIDYRGEYLMGTDYLLEALATRRGSSASATTRSTASGR